VKGPSPSGSVIEWKVGYTSEAQGLQLQSMVLLPKAHGDFPRKRYALLQAAILQTFNDPFGGMGLVRKQGESL
jgi:hypothetical protein